MEKEYAKKYFWDWSCPKIYDFIRILPEIFFAGGAAAPPAPTHRTPMTNCMHPGTTSVKTGLRPLYVDNWYIISEHAVDHICDVIGQYTLFFL